MKVAATFLLLLTFTFSSAQDQQKGTKAICIANWKKGEEKVLSITRNKIKSEPGEPPSAFGFSYEAHISVIDSTRDEYTVRWVFHLPASVKKENPELIKAMPVYEGLRMLFTTTGTGSFKKLVNWEEVRDAYVAMMEISLPKNSDDTLKASINQAKALFNSKEMVESALIREIQLYYAPFGAEFSKEGITGNSSLPNPLGPEPMPAIVTQKLTELNPETDVFKAVIDQQIDGVNASTIIVSLLRKMNIPEDSLMLKAKELLGTMDIKDHCEYSILQSTGWVLKLNYQRTAGFADMKQVETFLLELK